MGTIEKILEAKAYRQAKAMVDAADTAEARQRLPQTRLFELVQAIEMQCAAEALAKKRAKANG